MTNGHAVIGNSIAHSKSPQIHMAFGAADVQGDDTDGAGLVADIARRLCISLAGKQQQRRV